MLVYGVSDLCQLCLCVLLKLYATIFYRYLQFLFFVMYNYSSYLIVYLICCIFFFFKQNTEYDVRISDWSSDVCSSDLGVQLCARMTAWSTLNAFLCSVTNEAQFDVVTQASRAITKFITPAHMQGPFEDTFLAHCTKWFLQQWAMRGDNKFDRSEERRVGKECVSKCRSRESP